MNRPSAYFAATLLAVALGGSGESCCGQGEEQGTTGKLALARAVPLAFAAELWGQSEADGGTIYRDLDGRHHRGGLHDFPWAGVISRN